MRFNKASLWLSALLVLAGCPEETPPRLNAVTVTCAPATVMAGQPAQCTASATDEDGKPFTVSGYRWTSNNESVATVDSTGKVTTLSAGTVALSASATSEEGDSRQGQATVTVTPQPPRLSTVTVTCDPSSVSASRPTQCSASAKDQYGQPFAVASYVWASSNESVAKVGSTGRVTTFTAGTATISASATANGVTQQGQTAVTVTDAQPTVHNATVIATQETWRANQNPHVVRGLIEVRGASAPMLTLEEGVELRFDSDAEVVVTGAALRALGTQEAPIRMVANQSTPIKGSWRGVVFVGGGSTSEMNHVTLSDCGSSLGAGACIVLKSEAAPVLRHVTVRNSGTAGVAVGEDGSRFGPGSTLLTVSGSEGYAVKIGASEAGTLPTGGTFTGNARDAVEISGLDISVGRSQTWPNLGIPYVVRTSILVDGSDRPTLTLSAGTVLRFTPGTGLYVAELDKGELVVDGTAAAPVLFTSNSASPQPGEWGGVHLWGNTTGASRISHATIEYAGRYGGEGVGQGNLNVNGYGAGNGAVRPIITDVTVQKGSHYGVHLLNGGAFGPGSARVTARDNGSYPISMAANLASTLPSNGTFSGNTPNAVELVGHVSTTQTWPNPGLPYVIPAVLELDSATLTLTAGTELRFGSGSEFWIGYTSSAALVAVGTPTEPIHLGIDQTPPTKGDWGGLRFRNAAGSRLDHVSVRHGGAGGNTNNVTVYTEIGAFITNSTFSDSAACGIGRSDGSHFNTAPVTTNFTLPEYNNTFANNDGGAQCTITQ